MHLQRVDYGKPIQLSVLPSHFAPTWSCFWQSGPIMCIHWPVSPRVVRHIMSSAMALQSRKMSIQTLANFQTKLYFPMIKINCYIYSNRMMIGLYIYDQLMQ